MLFERKNMADPWNLTLDGSYFDLENSIQQEPIFSSDISKVIYHLNKVQDNNGISELESQLEEILGRNQYKDNELSTVLELISTLPRKLHLLNPKFGHLVIQKSKILFEIVTKSQETKSLKDYFTNIGCCLRSLQNQSEFTNSIICALQIIQQTYSICHQRTGSEPYLLFRPSAELFMIVLEMIDPSKFLNNELVEIVDSLLVIGQYLCKLEGKSMAIVWKLIIKILQQNADISQEINLGSALMFLAAEVKHLLELLIGMNNALKLIKVTGFLLKVMVTLIEINSCALDKQPENEAVLGLVLMLHRYTPDLLKYGMQINGDVCAVLESQVFVTIHPLLNQLMKNPLLLWKNIQKLILQQSNERLSLCLLLGLLLTPTYAQKVNQTLDMHELLDVFLNVVDQAHAELFAPNLLTGITHSAHGARRVPAFEFLVTQVCGGIATAKANMIPPCVAVLLHNAATKTAWGFLMACDILCFMARYGSAQFCQELVFHTFKVAQHGSRLAVLLNRLLPLLSNAGRSAVLKQFPLEQYPDIWASLNWSCFTGEQQLGFNRYYIQNNLQVHKAAALIQLHSLSCSNSGVMTGNVELLPSLMKLLTHLAAVLNSKAIKGYQKHAEFLVGIILQTKMNIVLVDQIDQQHYVMQLLKLAYDMKNILIVQFYATEFLQSMAAVEIPCSPSQQVILRCITNLYCELISSTSVIVQLSGLRSFELFAKLTPHSAIVPSSVKENQQQLVSNFISRKCNPVSDMSPFLNLQAEIFCRNSVWNYCLLPKLIVESSAESAIVTSAKRPRLDKADEDLQCLIQTLGQVIHNIGQYIPLSQNSKDQISEHLRLLNSYL